MSKTKVVIFALVRNGKVLLEKRPVPGFEKDQYLIPGGAVENTEELGVIPIEFELLTDDDIAGLFDNILKPFVIKKWKGKLPKFILDKEDPYPLEWVNLENALNIPIESTRIIIESLKKHL